MEVSLQKANNNIVQILPNVSIIEIIFIFLYLGFYLFIFYIAAVKMLLNFASCFGNESIAAFTGLLAVIAFFVLLFMYIRLHFKMYKSIREGYIIDFNTMEFKFPGKCYITEKTIFHHLRPSYYKRLIERYSIKLSEISSLREYTQRKKQDNDYCYEHIVSISGSFGGIQIVFSEDEAPKRDELYSALKRGTKL